MISLALDMCRPMQGGIFVLWFRGVGSELCTGGVVPPPPSPGVVMHGQRGGGGSEASMDNSDAVGVFIMESAMHTIHSVLHCH